MSEGLKKVKNSKKKKKDDEDDDTDMLKWTVCVKEDEDDDWDVLDNEMHDDKGSARQASAGARGDYEERKVIKVRYSNLE